MHHDYKYIVHTMVKGPAYGNLYLVVPFHNEREEISKAQLDPFRQLT